MIKWWWRWFDKAVFGLLNLDGKTSDGDEMLEIERWVMGRGGGGQRALAKSEKQKLEVGEPNEEEKM
ncbi:hypothetical protein ACOSQ3_015949 [Xanthoceras sorbifolium]